MRNIRINQDWFFGSGLLDLSDRARVNFGNCVVCLPHDYMISGSVYPEAPAGPASGYYSAGVAHYVKELDIPAE